ncbi:MAG: DUF2842 domain-containing protein, partial [Ancalomicrobiaceae bacterium]|nr:DUF2842 domain-containing protein [Ancalomicrobiaceae bacterium]
MPPRLKRLIGAIVILVFVIVYAFIASFVGDAVVASTSRLVQVLYFAVAGLVWIVPVGFVILWMYGKRRS